MTFIKMDIEGHRGIREVALRGGREIIARKKLKLSICVYHRLSDLLEILLWMKEVRID